MTDSLIRCPFSTLIFSVNILYITYILPIGIINKRRFSLLEILRRFSFLKNLLSTNISIKVINFENSDPTNCGIE